MATLLGQKQQDAIQLWANSAWVERLALDCIKKGVDINHAYEHDYYNLMICLNKLARREELDQSKIPQLGTLVEALYIAYNNNKE